MTTRNSLRKFGKSVAWATFAFLYYTGFLLLMEMSLVESVSFGIAIGIGFAVIFLLLDDWEPPRQERWEHKSHGSSFYWR